MYYWDRLPTQASERVAMGLAGQSSAVGRLEARVLSSPPKAAELLDLVDRVIAFTRAGIDGCTAPPKKR
jgi:hypothetical protein